VRRAGRSARIRRRALPIPRDYTPKHLAEKILTSRAALEGERKHVTVLFADLKSSMELLADRDPDDARKLVDPVLSLMMDAVHHYEGTVNQVMGDGIMALFGDTDRRELRRAGEEVPVEPQVFELLAYLISHNERVVGKDELLAAVWEGRIVSESAMTTRINAAPLGGR
jgi:class 3 adenylate cyclase